MSFSVWSVWLANGCHKSALVAGGQVVHDHVEIEKMMSASERTHFVRIFRLFALPAKSNVT